MKPSEMSSKSQRQDTVRTFLIANCVLCMYCVLQNTHCTNRQNTRGHFIDVWVSGNVGVVK